MLLNEYNLFYILSLTDKDKTIWNRNYQMSNSFSPRSKRYFSYSWDLKKLSEDIADNDDLLISKDDESWSVFLIGDFKDNSGSKILEPINTIFTPTVFTNVDFSKNIFTGSFSYTPKEPVNIEGSENEFKNAESIIYASCVYPGYPLMLANTNRTLYGPIFFNSISFSCDTFNQISPVNINISFIAPKRLITEEMDAYSYKNIEINNDLPEIPYRNIMSYDCMVLFDEIENYNDLHDKYIVKKDNDELPLITSISLNFDQAVSKSVYDEEKRTFRFLQITDYTITGSISFLRRQDYDFDTGNALSIAFGCAFVFSFKDVDYSNIERDFVQDNLILEKVDFVAKIDPEAINLIFQDQASNQNYYEKPNN